MTDGWVIMGVDPGIQNTGILIIKDRELVFNKGIYTKSGIKPYLRIDKIVGTIEGMIKEYKVNIVACESFDHQSWNPRPLRAANLTERLINELSWIAAKNNVLFTLQSAKEAKTKYSSEDIDEIFGKHITPVHAVDAGKHALTLSDKLIKETHELF